VAAAVIASFSAIVAVPAASASAAAPSIEGVWSFNGGAVIVAPDESGQLVGTVTSPTTFDKCVHPVGQAIWTDLQLTANGMYAGMHVWYRDDGTTCVELPELGPIALRVLTLTDGSVVLRVCFNHPGTTAPLIAPSGAPSNVNYGCSDSAPVSGVPTAQPTFAGSVKLPPTGAKVCVSRRDFVIHIREPRHDPFVKLTVYLGRKVFKVVRHGENITANIDLRGLPKGTYTVRIRARTAAGYIVKGSRTYHTCVPKIHSS
jgi:hypothetical protein